MLLADCCLSWDWMRTMGSSVLVTCNLIGKTVVCDILLIYSDLAPEYTWVEAAHAWVFVVNSGGMRGGRIFPQICPWWCCQLTPWRRTMPQPRLSSWGEVKTLLSHNSEATHSLTCCRDTSLWHFGHYHWAGYWRSRLLLVKRVGCFFTAFFWVCHSQSYCCVHQRTVSDCWQGRRCILWRIGSFILATFFYTYNQMVCDGQSSPVGHYNGDIGSTLCLGAQLWMA